MKRISKAALVTVAILSVVFLANPAVAGRKPPPDPLIKALQEAGLKQLEDEVVRQIGQALEVGARLRLDHRTAIPPTTVPIDNFQPKKLELTPETINQRLEPGDYTLDVIGYCTKWSLHYPGRGLPYKLAHLQGRAAEAVGALLWRGTLKGMNPRHLNAMAWRIQGGVPISQWRPQERELAHQLIREHEAELNGDFLEQTRSTYDKAAKIGKLPKYETLLGQMGPVGETVLDLQRARKVLANKTLAAERMPDLLYGRPRDGLPRTLTGGPNDPPSSWSEIVPGVFARLTIIQGNMGRNVLDLRITPQAGKPSAVAPRARIHYAVDSSTRGFAIVLAMIYIEEDPYTPEKPNILDDLFWYIHDLVAYPEGRPAQALILVPHVFCTSMTDCGEIGIRG